MESKAQLRHMRCMRNMAERFDEIVLGSKKQATKESLQESEIGSTRVHQHDWLRDLIDRILARQIRTSRLL